MNEQVAHHPALVGWTSAQPVIRAYQIERVQERALRVDEVLANGSCAIERRHAGRLALVRPAVNWQPWQCHGVARHLPYALPFKGRTPRVGRLNRNAEVSGKVSILAWLVLGLIAGWLAGMLMKGGGYGIVGDIVLGILGALVGGWLTGVLFGQDLMTGFNVVSLIVAVLGAIVLIGISRLLTGGRASTRV